MSGGKSKEARSTCTSTPSEIMVATGVSNEAIIGSSSYTGSFCFFDDFELSFLPPPLFFSISFDPKIRFEADANVELPGVDGAVDRF